MGQKINDFICLNKNMISHSCLSEATTGTKLGAAGIFAVVWFVNPIRTVSSFREGFYFEIFETTKLYSQAKIAPPIRPSASAQKKPIILPSGLIENPRYTRPIIVTSWEAPSKRMIHHVKRNTPMPHNRPHVIENAFTLNFIAALFFWFVKKV
jgi:hypothetical protein